VRLGDLESVRITHSHALTVSHSALQISAFGFPDFSFSPHLARLRHDLGTTLARPGPPPNPCKHCLGTTSRLVPPGAGGRKTRRRGDAETRRHGDTTPLFQQLQEMGDRRRKMGEGRDVSETATRMEFRASICRLPSPICHSRREPFLHRFWRFRSAVPFVFKGFVETGNRQRYTPRRFADGGIVTVVTVTCDRLKAQEKLGDIGL
jgi:hypothetical protein